MGPVHTLLLLLLLAGWASAQDRPKTVAFQGKYRSWGTPALPSLSSSVFGGRQCWGMQGAGSNSRASREHFGGAVCWDPSHATPLVWLCGSHLDPASEFGGTVTMALCRLPRGPVLRAGHI